MSEPLRVLQVIGSMNCGGAEAMLMNFYRNIDRSKVQFDFLVCNKDRAFYDDEIESLGGRIYRELEYINPSNLISYKAICERFFSKHNYKIVHCHIGSIAWFVLSVAKKYGAFTITHSHSTYAGLGILPYRLLSYPDRYTPDYFFGCSELAGIKRYGKRVANNPNIFSVLNNAINVDNYTFNNEIRRKIREELLINEDQLVIGHVGRFDKAKNQAYLVNVFEKLHKIDENAKLVLVGTGENVEAIKKQIKELNLESSVILTGVRSDVCDLLQAFDVFVFPSIYEGLPVTVIEAQASGLKCLLSDTITKEVDITGLVEYMSLNNSASEWAEKILSMLPYDRVDTSDKIAAAGYDIKTTAKQLTEFYLNIQEKK